MDNTKVAAELVKIAKELVSADDSNQIIVKIDKSLKENNFVDSLDLLKKFHKLVNVESNISWLDRKALKELTGYIIIMEKLSKQQSVYGKKVMGVLDHFGYADF